MTYAYESEVEKRLSEEDCLNFYHICNTPENVIGHCREVGRVAGGLAASLNRAGYHFDEELCRMAGYVHDIMRTYPNHGEEGAKVLLKHGFVREADLVRDHMHYDFGTIDNLTEMDLLCLADRMVEDDQYVGLEKRIRSLIKRRGFGPEKTELFLAKMEETKDYIKQIESITGESFDSLFLNGDNH